MEYNTSESFPKSEWISKCAKLGLFLLNRTVSMFESHPLSTTTEENPDSSTSTSLANRICSITVLFWADLQLFTSPQIWRRWIVLTCTCWFSLVTAFIKHLADWNRQRNEVSKEMKVIGAHDIRDCNAIMLVQSWIVQYQFREFQVPKFSNRS